MKYEIRFSRCNANGKWIDDGWDNNYFKGYTKEEAEKKAKEYGSSSLISNIRIIESK